MNNIIKIWIILLKYYSYFQSYKWRRFRKLWDFGKQNTFPWRSHGEFLFANVHFKHFKTGSPSVSLIFLFISEASNSFAEVDFQQIFRQVFNCFNFFCRFSYNEKDEGCSSYVPMWEAVAHRFGIVFFCPEINLTSICYFRLRGLVHVARLEIAENDDVAERFHVDETHECPSFIL